MTSHVVMFVFSMITIASMELSRKTLRQTLFWNLSFAFQIHKIICYDQIVLLLPLICVKEEYKFSVFQFLSKMVFEKTSHFRLKLGFIVFFLSIFRITPKTSSEFRLSISSLNFDCDKKNLSIGGPHACMTSWWKWIHIKLMQIIALGIYLKLSNKWSKEAGL